MELDDLKSVWQQYNQQQVSKQAVDAEAIKELLRGKTKNITEKIVHNILTEVALVVILMVGSMIVFSLSLDKALWYANSVYLFICVLSFIFYSILYQKIQRVKINSQNIKVELSQLLVVLHNYTNLYLAVSVALIPPSLLFGFLYGYLKNGGSLSYLFADTIKLLVAITTLVVFFFIGYAVVKVYINHMYGKYIHTLKGYLQELQDDYD